MFKELWARSKVFRVVVLVPISVFVVVVTCLTLWHLRDLLGFSFSILLTIAGLVFGYVIYKKGYYVKKNEDGSQKSYFGTFVVKEKRILAGGALTGLVILPILEKLFGPFSYELSIILYFIFFAVGAVITFMLGRKLGWY
jgi:hypothetical protein